LELAESYMQIYLLEEPLSYWQVSQNL
jgi:hypothetical protein